MSDSDNILPPEEIKKRRILALAFGEANKYGIGAFAIAAAATAAGIYKSKKFNQFTSVSAKASLPIMAGLALWSFKYEMVIHDAKMHPENWGLNDEALIHHAKSHTHLPIHHAAMNYIYDHPFQLVAALGVPLAATILHQQKYNPHLTLSQKIMHSRVFAQGGILAILLSTMAFREFMDRRGKYKEDEEDDVKKQ
jgi:hypothetical protein